MCQIIGIQTTGKKIKKLCHSDNTMLRSFLLASPLSDKGGDNFSVALTSATETQFYYQADSFNPIWDNFINFIQNESTFFDNEAIAIIFFSRQKPEMEIEGEIEPQPYWNSSRESFVAIHGTIYNDAEIANTLGVEIKVDTEIFKFLSPTSILPKGSFALVESRNGLLTTLNNGLKIWEYPLCYMDENFGNIVATTSLDDIFCDELSDFYYEKFYMEEESQKYTLMAAFSTGMDITLSLFRELRESPITYHEVYLNYFAWGSIAETEEMVRLEKIKNYFIKEFKDFNDGAGIDFKIKIWDIKPYFDNYFDNIEAKKPKIHVDNKSTSAGNKGETESPQSYVPYRNTQFALLMAAFSEAKNLSDVKFLFGLNLSEGMVFMDNSEGWMESITNTIRYGGKDWEITNKYEIIAPYFTRTKSNMLKEFVSFYGIKKLQELLDFSFSCYYPNEDGSPCGNCGSCILRQKALDNL
jgi:7-cyano-7-deazaguanine synthase in queuosine biosynthesis